MTYNRIELIIECRKSIFFESNLNNYIWINKIDFLLSADWTDLKLIESRLKSEIDGSMIYENRTRIELDKRKTFAISLNYCNNNNILIILQKKQINKRGNQII